jgi:hypothetical protein
MEGTRKMNAARNGFSEPIRTQIVGREIARIHVLPVRGRPRQLVITVTIGDAAPAVNLFTEWVDAAGNREVRFTGKVRSNTARQLAAAISRAADVIEQTEPTADRETCASRVPIDAAGPRRTA